MVKLLVSGSVEGSSKILEDRVQQLQASQAGPFDLLIVLGLDDNVNIESLLLPTSI